MDIHRPSKSKARGKASITDILGRQARNGKPPAKWADHHAELIRLRDHLSGQRLSHAASAAAESSTTGTGEHMADAATDSYDRDWELAMASSDQSLLYEVDAALNRIANGSYGVCEVTGQRIEASRLKALPWARFCAAAQAELESRGAAQRVQRGSVGCYGGQSADGDASDEGELEESSTERKAA